MYIAFFRKYMAFSLSVSAGIAEISVSAEISADISADTSAETTFGHSLVGGGHFLEIVPMKVKKSIVRAVNPGL